MGNKPSAAAKQFKAANQKMKELKGQVDINPVEMFKFYMKPVAKKLQEFTNEVEEFEKSLNNSEASKLKTELLDAQWKFVAMQKKDKMLPVPADKELLNVMLKDIKEKCDNWDNHMKEQENVKVENWNKLKALQLGILEHQNICHGLIKKYDKDVVRKGYQPDEATRETLVNLENSFKDLDNEITLDKFENTPIGYMLTTIKTVAEEYPVYLIDSTSSDSIADEGRVTSREGEESVPELAEGETAEGAEPVPALDGLASFDCQIHIRRLGESSLESSDTTMLFAVFAVFLLIIYFIVKRFTPKRRRCSSLPIGYKAEDFEPVEPEIDMV